MVAALVWLGDTMLAARVLLPGPVQLVTTAALFAGLLSGVWRWWQPAHPDPVAAQTADTDEQISPWFTLVYAFNSPLHVLLRTPMFMEAWRSTQQSVARWRNRRSRLLYRFATAVAVSALAIAGGRTAAAAAAAAGGGLRVSPRSMLPRAGRAAAAAATVLCAPHSLLLAWACDSSPPPPAPRDLRAVFSRYDCDGDGLLDSKELKEMLLDLGRAEYQTSGPYFVRLLEVYGTALPAETDGGARVGGVTIATAAVGDRSTWGVDQKGFDQM